MAIVYMDRSTVNNYDSNIDARGFEYDSGDLDSAGNGDTVMIPDSVQNISIVLEVSGGSGKVQFTTNKIQDVIVDNDVVWHDWDAGEVVVNTIDVFFPVTAIKMVNVSGTTRLIVRAQ